MGTYSFTNIGVGIFRANNNAVLQNPLAQAEGVSTFRIITNMPVSGVATANFGSNTLDNTTINLPNKAVPFNFSTTPGLIAIGAISGLNFLAKRYKQRKKDDKSDAETFVST